MTVTYKPHQVGNKEWKTSSRVTVRFWNFSVLKLFHFFYGIVSVLKNFGIENSNGIGFKKNLVSKKVSVSEKNWYRKKYRIRYRKKLVSKKVLDLVSFRFWVLSHFGKLFIIFENDISLLTLYACWKICTCSHFINSCRCYVWSMLCRKSPIIHFYYAKTASLNYQYDPFT